MGRPRPRGKKGATGTVRRRTSLDHSIPRRGSWSWKRRGSWSRNRQDAPARHYSLTVTTQVQASVLLSLSPLMNRAATTERADVDFLFRFRFPFLFLCLGVTINLTFTLAFHLFPFLCSSSLVASCSAVCQFWVPVHMDGWRWTGKAAAAAAAAVAFLLLSTAPPGGARRGTSIRLTRVRFLWKPSGIHALRPGSDLLFCSHIGVFHSRIPHLPFCFFPVVSCYCVLTLIKDK